MLTRIISLTLAGSVPLLLLLAAERLFPRVWTWSWRYYARLVSVFAFLMPVIRPVIVIQSSYEPPVFLEQPLEIFTGVSDTLMVTPAAPSLFPKVLLAAWLAGVLAFVVYRLAAWLRFCTAVRRVSMPTGEAEHAVLEQCRTDLRIKRPVRLCICPGMGAPALAGILRPTILLPQNGIPAQELRFILHHELTHLRRCDITYKLAVQLVCALHWFNPFAWLLARQVGELCELSCDESTVRDWDCVARKAYGSAILSQIASTHYGLPQIVPGFSAAKQILMKRLNVIMNIRKPNKRHAILGILTAFAISSTGAMTALALAPTNEHTAIVIVPGEWGPENSYAARLKGVTLELPSDKAKDEESRLLPAKDAETEQPTSGTSKAGDPERLIPAKDADLAQLIPEGSTPQPVVTEQPQPEKKDASTKLVPANIVYKVNQDGDLVPAEGVAAPELAIINPLASKHKISLGILGYKGHTGMDFAALEGTEILAAADGIVLPSITYSNGYGNYVNIDHGNGVYTFYAQCQKLLVAEGDQVKQGQVIATVGKTGRATGPHLHFELRMGEYVLDPEQYITQP